jgi:hypothetical protein
MIDLISKKVLFMILLFLGVGVATISTTYYYIVPAKVKYEQEANALKQKAGEVQAEIDRIRFEFEKIQSQIEGFKALQEKGFFNAQDRVTAREAITRLTRRAKVSADIKFSAAALVPNIEVDAAKHKLLSGPMSISIRSMNDVAAYKFVLGLQKAFPGYLQLRSFDVTRDVSGKFMDKIGAIKEGTESTLVNGNVNLIWWSMASEEQLQADPSLNPALIAPQPADPSAQPVP